jgi:4-hydroxy-2-oxovalerate aldolase
MCNDTGMALTLLDCTLRDGSYAIDFQFTAKFTQEFCSVIDELGFQYIEVGHGMGIGAGTSYRRAAATDFEYGTSAQLGVKSSKWGMFAQPSFTKLKDVDCLIDIGMNFVRVGVDINSIEAGLDFVGQLCSREIEVYVNLMKSYVTPPDLLVEIMRKFVTCGVEGIYLVDSAGGMLPKEVVQYSKAMHSLSTTTKLGFHGHDNLGLAVSNSLLVADAGFSLIDCTMQGMGRSSGNASSEKLVASLIRNGYKIECDLIKLLKCGEELIRPKLPVAGHSGLDTFAGFTLFHTSYMEDLLDVSRKFGVDPYALMQEHCETNLLTANISDLEITSSKLISRGRMLDSPFPIDRYVGREQV